MNRRARFLPESGEAASLDATDLGLAATSWVLRTRAQGPSIRNRLASSSTSSYIRRRRSGCSQP